MTTFLGITIFKTALIDAEGANIRITCREGIYAESAYIKDVCFRYTCIGGVCINSAGIVKCLEMHL